MYGFHHRLEILYQVQDLRGRQLRPLPERLHRRDDHALQDDVVEAVQDVFLPLELAVAAKALAHWLTTGLPLVVAAPLLGLSLRPVLDDKGRTRMKPVLDEDGDFVVLTVAKKSDSLLQFALGGYRKGTFASRTELTGANGKDLNEGAGLSEVERVARVAALLDAARRRLASDIL